MGPAALGEHGFARRGRRRSLRGSIVEEIFGNGLADLGVLYGRIWAEPWRSMAAGIPVVEPADRPGPFAGSSRDSD